MTERGRKPVDIGVVIRAARWRAFRAEAEDAIVEKRITAEGIRALDRWLAHRESAAVGDLSADAVLSFFADSISPNPIRKLLRALHAADPGHPDLPVLSQAMELRSRSYRPTKETRARSRTPKVSVETRELPPEWLEVLDAMRSREYRGRQPPAPSIVVTIETKLRQLAFSARAAGVTIDFAIPALSAYVEAMLARDLASRTIESALGKLRTFGTYAGAPAPVLEAIVAEKRLHDLRASTAGKRKERFLLESGLTLDGVARKALDCYRSARVGTDPRERHHDWMRAALFGFVICRPLRPLDVRTMIVGRHLRRDSEGWQLFKRTRKNNYKAIGRIWDVCTPFLDGAILLGADESRFWEMYDRAEGRPLLADRQGEALCDNWATEQSRAYLGTGIGIVRTLWHDHCAEVGDARAVETALALCGQYDPRTAAHYRTAAGERDRMARAQDLLGDIVEELGGSTP